MDPPPSTVVSGATASFIGGFVGGVVGGVVGGTLIVL